MTPQTDTDAQLKIMVKPVKHQKLIDQLGVLVLTGAVDRYAGKQATEDGNWKRARRLIAEGTREGEEAE